MTLYIPVSNGRWKVVLEWSRGIRVSGVFFERSKEALNLEDLGIHRV